MSENISINAIIPSRFLKPTDIGEKDLISQLAQLENAVCRK